MSFMSKRVKRRVERMGVSLLIKRERGSAGKKESKFRSEGGLFSNRGAAEAYASRYFPNSPMRVVGVKVDFTPVFIPERPGSRE